MNKLKMAHDWVMNFGDIEYPNMTIEKAWDYADAMQAEADKRETRCSENIEINMYPEYDATINYPPDAWVVYQGEKRLAVSIDIDDEWQPDWSQLPSVARYWAMDGCGMCNVYENEPEICGSQWDFGGAICECDSFGYKGDWRNSLRKRPQ